jgi:predicted extracellular nuclease
MKLKYSVALALFCASSAQATSVFINEIHYDNIGDDANEFVEIAAPAGTILDGMSIVLYNGSSTQLKPYNSFDLSGVVSDQSDGYGFTSVSTTAIQNGSPDGIALVNAGGTVIQFLSYEGVFTAAEGPAATLESVDIGQRESNSTTAVGHSMQLSGIGTEYADFTWEAPSAATSGLINTGQSFGSEIVDSAPTILSILPASGATNVATDANIVVTFSEAVVVTAWNVIDCDNEGAITVTTSGEGASYTLNPDTDFSSTDSCSFTISADDVTDLDGDPNNLAEDLTITFDVIDTSITVDLIINEFQADPAAGLDGDANGDGTRDSSDDEFIELVNPTESGIDISGWTLSDSTLRHTFPSGTVVDAGCAVVVFGGGTPTGTFGGAIVQAASEGSVGLSNSGDTFTLSNGVASIQASYSGSDGGSNQSLTLNPDITGLDYERHSDIVAANGARFSPGTKLDGSPFDGCTVPLVAPVVNETSPLNEAEEVPIASAISVTFSENVLFDGNATLLCTISGDVAFTVTQEERSFSLQPDAPLAAAESCSLTIPASAVVDEDEQTLDADFVLGFSTVTEVLSCAVDFTLIQAVQGSGATSPLVGQRVSLQGVVTAVMPNLTGYFVQEEDVNSDNAGASKGIFIFNQDAEFAYPEVGDLVAMSGEVSEFNEKTQVTLSEAPVVCAIEVYIEPVALSLPFGSDHDFESFEGMLVSFAQELSVTNTFELGRRGEFELSSQLKFSPTNQFLPGSAEAIALADQNSRDVILIDDGNFRQNVDSVIYPTGGLSAANTLRLDDRVNGVIGVIDYDGNRRSVYQVIPIEPLIFTVANPRPQTPELESGNLRVASFNVLNFFNGDGQGGGFPTPRGADSADNLERQAVKIIAALVTMNADIVGLVEIENDGYGAQSAIQELVDRLNNKVGDGTYVFVDPGVDRIGTDAISVGFIYKPAVVSLQGVANILNSVNSIKDDSGTALFLDEKNRPALAQEFVLQSTGKSVVITINHLKSKGSDCNALGDPDIGDGQANCNITRTNASTAIVAWLEDIYADKPILVMGDLNANAKEDPIRVFESASYTNLIAQFEGDNAYSFSFRGEVGYLDHALANTELLSSIVDATEWHINADEPGSLDYTTRFKSDFNIQNYYAPDTFRSSDHDPVLISLNLEADAVLGDWDADGDVDINDYRGLIRAIQRRQPVGMEFDLNGDGRITTSDARFLLSLCTRSRCAA